MAFDSRVRNCSRPQASRSLHGCWTCRLRRKKCDETHPNCSICVGLGVGCLGYGPRPLWMDGGDAEKEQATKVKRLIKKNKRTRRELQQTSLVPTNPLPGQLTPVSRTSQSKSESLQCSNLPAGDCGAWFFDELDMPPLDLAQLSLDIHLSNEPERQSLERRLSLNENYHDINQLPWEDAVEVNPQSFVPADSLNFSNSLLPSRNIWSPVTLSTATIPESTSWLTSGNSAPSRSASISSQESQSTQQTIKSRNRLATPILLDTADSQTLGPTSFGESILNIGERHDEAALFMHYLDCVFYIQFPFYDLASNDGCRAWILNLLMRDRSVYHAALTLSQYHHHYSQPSGREVSNGYNSSQLGEGYHILALRELQDAIGQTHTWSGTKGLVRSVQVLACALHLIFFELLGGGTGPWPMHLRAASSLAPHVAKALTTPKELSMYGGERVDEKLLSSEDRVATSVILSAFIWFDILACASTGSKPFLDLDHISLLEDASISMQNMPGCENWVLAFIFKISELSAWKLDLLSKDRLSVAELARRGSQIETSLTGKLEDLSHQAKRDISPELLPGRRSRSVRLGISKIFALATLTYLHVTVSGANYQLPEIIGSVSKTIEAFKALADAKLFRYLAWPFCVTACMASEEHQEFFRTLAVEVEREEKALGTWKEALKIAEECWNGRKTSGNRDWISTMKSLGQCIILA